MATSRGPTATVAPLLRPLAAALLAALPLAAGALDLVLRPPRLGPADLSVRPAALGAAAEDPGALDFDLLGEAKPPPDAPDARLLARRRTMLTTHQGIGFGLVGLQLATTVVGQLSYADKFGGNDPANTDRYRLSHAGLAYATVGVFAVNGAIALLAPSPVKKPARLDRVMVHRIAMFTAAAGMLAQAGVGIYTSSREGYLNQQDPARLHLALGYATLAALGVGVGVLVF